MTEQWVAKKLEVLVDVPEQVDLEWLRGSGPQPHDQLQPEEPAASSQAGALGTLAAAAGAPLPCLYLLYLFGQHCACSVYVFEGSVDCCLWQQNGGYIMTWPPVLHSSLPASKPFGIQT